MQVELVDIHKHYGAVKANDGVSLTVAPGDLHGILGENGAGKSTLMKILAGLLEPTAGGVFFQGADIVRNPEYVWERLGYLPQDFGFYPHLTGEEMLAFLLRLKGVEGSAGLPALVKDLLERVNLGFAARRRVKDYSGGMRQRLGIAQAIAGRPPLIVVDEPTSGLDPEERLRFYHLLAELGQDSTVILSTHIVEDVAVLCPRFAVIQAGRVVKQTTPTLAVAELEGRIWEGFVDRHVVPQLQRDFFVTQTVLYEGRQRTRIHIQAGEPPAGFRQAQPTLEDAYFLFIRQGAVVPQGRDAE
jgi:ABC-type multidrug transport system ATPase subunit